MYCLTKKNAQICALFKLKYVNFLKLEWEVIMSGKKTSSWQQILNRTFLHLNFQMAPLGIKVALFYIRGKPLMQKSPIYIFVKK